MFLNEAFAAETTTTSATTTTPSAAGSTAELQSNAMAMNIGMVVVMAVLFYALLIRPQQKRFKDHANMINKLGQGTKVVTQGGLIGVIEKNLSDNDVLIDFGNNVKMAMLRSYIIGPYADMISPPANDDSKSKKDKSSK